MKKSEAIQAMREGKKVTHRYFDSTEWMTLVGNRVVFEDGVEMWLGEFIEDRKDEAWETDWSIFEEPSIKGETIMNQLRSAEEMTDLDLVRDWAKCGQKAASSSISYLSPLEVKTMSTTLYSHAKDATLRK